MEKFPSVVSDIMKDLVTINGSKSVKEAAEVMLEKGIGSIVVTEDGEPVGIVTKSDLLAKVIVNYRNPSESKISEIMSSPLIYIESKMPILDAMREMRHRNVRRLLVMEDGEISGIVSEYDMINAIIISSLTQFSTLLRRK